MTLQLVKTPAFHHTCSSNLSVKKYTENLFSDKNYLLTDKTQANVSLITMGNSMKALVYYGPEKNMGSPAKTWT